MLSVSNPNDTGKVLVVVVELDQDRSRRRIYLTLGAAQRAAERAETSGHDVTVHIAELHLTGEAA